MQVLDLLVGDLDAKLVLQGHHHIHDVQAVGLEIFQDIAFHRDLILFDVQLFGQHGADSLENVH